MYVQWRYLPYALHKDVRNDWFSFECQEIRNFKNENG